MKNQIIKKFAKIPFLVFITMISAHVFCGAAQKLTIGTKEAAPFSMKGVDGSWTGISIDLMQEIAKELDFQLEFKEQSLSDMLKNTQDKQLDASIAAISITPDRERVLDFSHVYYTTGLGIAVSSKGQGSRVGTIFKALFSKNFFKALLALGFILLIAGLAVWVLERKKNSDQFGGKPIEGIGAAFWWSAVTMTTVGYGDKAPTTFWGRVVGLIWMFASVIIISSFTAAIASSLTVNQLGSVINGPEDLPGKKVAAIKGSATPAHLRKMNVSPTLYASAEEAMEAVSTGKVVAFVHDAPLLQYLAINTEGSDIRVLPQTFVRQDYGIALPTKSALREPINNKLLEVISRSEWKEIKARYLGE